MSAPAPTAGPRRLPIRPLPLLGLAVALALVVATLVVVLRPGGSRTEAGAACPEGYSPLTAERSEAEREREAALGGEEAEREREREAAEAAEVGEDADAPCWPTGAVLPEDLAELALFNNTQSTMMGYSSPASMRRAQAQAAALAKVHVPGDGGTWRKVSNGILDERDPAYPAGGYGNTLLAGRISNYSLADDGTVYAGVANGGVWRSRDSGRSWTDISRTLPTQIVGAIGWTRAGGSKGTLLALTGDNSFGQYNWSGSGLFWSTDEGRHWHHAKGIPGGLLAFKVQVAPDSPGTVYAATGNGLFRSDDAGRSFRNVELPTVPGCTQTKHFFDEKCALSSVVTDVIVRGKDSFGHTGGAVVAAVGWRAGDQENADGTPQAPANGLYTSETGKPGSFTKLPDSSGFAPAANVGRVSFGNAYGPDQDHDYLYALVQDAKLLQQGGVEVVPDEFGNGVTSNNIVSYVNGAYVSDDFGQTWTLMEDTTGFTSQTTGSSLAAIEALGIAPGVQAWYNNWIQPDPYEQVNGIPTNVMLGMEEIWQTGTRGVPQVGRTDFRVVAPYAGGTYGCVLVGNACSLGLQTTGLTSAHPDQHAVLFLPPADGSLTREILAGSDGGNYVAQMPPAGLLKQTDFVAAQDGFNTLIPYAFDVSRDGTVVDGMQDNGSMVWRPGWQESKETYPGDGGTTLIDPDDSQTMIISLAIGSSLYLNTAGGQGESVLTGDDITPEVGTRYTYGALQRDEAKPTRIIYAGRQVAVADAPMADLTTDSWSTVFDLGTRTHPGDAAATPGENDPELQASANDIYDGTAYVGYCGACQTITGTDVVGAGGKTFTSGIATNYGGTWHVAKAQGLPDRLVNAVLVDHRHPGTVYAGLGVSTKRQAFHPGVTGKDGVTKGGGFLYVSTDGGEHFRDISGSLPDVGVLSLVQHGRQVVAGTTLGPYLSTPMGSGTPRWGRLGKGLPAIAVAQMRFRPGHPDQLYAATWGRGIYRIDLA